MKYYFIVNPGSRTGNGKNLWKEHERQLDNSKIDYEVFFTEGPGHATKLAEQICREHPEMKRIVIVGGDGTANEAVNGLSDYSKIILGFVPNGSANDLAAGLGIPNDSVKAMERIIHPRLFKRVDHGLVSFEDEESRTKKFAVSAGIGYDAQVCYEALNSRLKKFLNKLHIGGLIYYLLGIKLIFSNKPSKATFIIDGKRKLHYDRLVFAAAMNTKYEGGGMPMNPSADPCDGKISLCILHDVSRLWHVRLMPTILNSTHTKYRGIEQITCNTCEIITEEPMYFHTDGEVEGRHNHVVISCTPEKIKMML